MAFIDDLKIMYPVNYITITRNGPDDPHGDGHSYPSLDLGWSAQYGGQNQPIYAGAQGTVTTVVNNFQGQSTTPNYGNYIIIDVGQGIQLLYAHNQYMTATVNVGSSVGQGQQIANMGDTGYAFGNHCHYEIRINGTRVNPLLYSYAYSGQIISDSSRFYNEILRIDTPSPEPIDKNILFFMSAILRRQKR